MAHLIHELIAAGAATDADRDALLYKDETLSYGELWLRVQQFASALPGLPTSRQCNPTDIIFAAPARPSSSKQSKLSFR